MKKALKFLGWFIAVMGAVGFAIDVIDHIKNKANSRKQNFYEKWIKRPQDFFCALAALIVLSPVMGITAWMVKKKLGSPVLFTQDRPGLNGKIFKLYKFRSMTDAKDENGNLLPDEDRLPHFGVKLRDTSLDELPELFNILKGDMSVIGPRPLLVRDMTFMTDKQKHRHDVHPGLSGWAQVNGRNAIEWEDKLNYDLEYIKNISFAFDWKIIWTTVGKIFRTESITYGGMATAEDFGDYLLRTGQVSKTEYDEKQEEAKKLIEEVK